MGSLLFLFCVLRSQHSEVCGCSVGNICSVEHKEVLYAAAEGAGFKQGASFAVITRRTKCPETQITVLRMASALPPGVEKSSRAGAPRSRKPACLRGAIQVARDACRGTDHLCGASRWLPHGDWPNALEAHLRERKTDGLASFIARLCGPMAGTAEPMEFPECSSRTP